MAVGGFINLPAVIIIGLLTGVLILGAKESTRINAAIVIANIAVIVIFIVVGLKYINPANYTPFTPFGLAGVFQGAAMVFFAYIGFDAVSTAAEETKDPQKNLPKGIIGSLIISSILYIVVAAVLTGMVPYYLLNNGAPVAFALQYVGSTWIASVVSIGALCGITSVLLTSLFGQTRIFFAMSRDGLLPGIFSRVHSTYKSPVTSIILVGTVAAFIAAFIPLALIIELVNIGTLSAFIFLAISVIVLRRTQPDIKRGFKCPLVPIVPILSIISCLFLINQLSSTTLQRFAVSLIIGVSVYFLYGMRRSKLNNSDDVDLNGVNLIATDTLVETELE
jgi:APA family basic amino acid/polyamine antiporter